MRCRRATGRESAPARVGDRGGHVVFPAAVDEQICGRVALDLEPAALEDGCAARVSGHVVGGDPVELPDVECKCDRAMHRFGHIALSLLIGGEVVKEDARLDNLKVLWVHVTDS